MLEDYRFLIGQIYSWTFWPIVLLGFYACKDANVRWTLFMIGGMGLIYKLIAWFLLPAISPPGYVYHLIQIVVYVILIKILIVFRPLVTFKLGSIMAKIPIIGILISTVLPARYSAKIFMAELAMRRVCYAFVLSHSIVICHYIMFYLGALDPGGIYEMAGIYQLALWDLALATHSVGLTLELLLLLSLIITGCKRRLTLKV